MKTINNGQPLGFLPIRRTDIGLGHKGFKKFATLLTLLAVLILQFGTALIQAGSAAAATTGPGIYFAGMGHNGGYRLANGELAYCIENGVADPYGNQSHSATVTELPAYETAYNAGAQFGLPGVLQMPAVTNPEVIRQINYLIDRWGDTTNNEQAAATQLAVFQLRGDPTGFTDGVLQEVRNQGRQDVYDLAQYMVAESRLNAVAPIAAVTVPAPELNFDAHGLGQVTYAAGVTKMTLEGAVFTASGVSVLHLSGNDAGVLEVQALKPYGWDSSYDVTLRSEWQSGREGWLPEITLHYPESGGQQRIAVATGKSVGQAIGGSYETVASVTNYWWPSVTTQVSNKFVDSGQKFIDTVTLAAADAGGHWSQEDDGTYMPIVVKGTLYGPFLQDPSVQPQDDAPTDAPVADQVELRATAGPGDYLVESNIVAAASGYYTWVWGVDWSDQDDSVSNPDRTGVSALKRDRLPIKDRFGEQAETHLHTQRLTIVTRLNQSMIGRGWSVTDEVGVTKEKYGGWLQDAAGLNVPVVLRGTLYHTELQPQVAEYAPGEAIEIGHTFVTVTGPQIVDSEPLAVPADLTGFVSMQWCVLVADQPTQYRGFTRQWCDDFGLPGEIAEIVSPTVTTKAKPEALVGDTIFDTAQVTGPIPNGATIDFTAYLKPEVGQPKYDADWNEIEGQESGSEVWSAAEIEALQDELCMAQPVATVGRVAVFEAGEIVSADVEAKSIGTVHWVERLYAIDPITAQEVLIHQGECGLIAETTVISKRPEPKLAETGAKLALPVTALFLGVTSIAMGLGLLSKRIGFLHNFHSKGRQDTF